MMSKPEGQPPRAIHLKDYTPPAFLVTRIDLNFDLFEHETRVKSRLMLTRNPAADGAAPLVLDGKGLALKHIQLNDRVLAEGTDYVLTAESLTIPRVEDRIVLETEVAIHPETNTELEGLYKSGGMFCTQCEAEGFRKITFFPDRPDVMARFTTTVVADKAAYPVLLSNGNLVGEGDLGDGRHFARWEDPFPKPAYLFALVAGDLACLEDSFTTRSGRTVALRIFTHKPDIDKCEHAMGSIQRSMKWDEEVYGLEYDLEAYMIVAVGDFNMGAMENKGLNIFNTKYVLAKPETATDFDFQHVEAVIAHEYFHNWTGNRVTCRDWFQLSLKEGLTVFRDQQFSADMGSSAVKRIGDVRTLRAAQFPEDAGPMAHPVRPDAYIEINNFYTATVYNKGAEVVRMQHTLLGKDKFRAGMDLYFQRHDGQAVTCDDFVAAMEDAGGIDLTQFRRWYAQAGTPVLTVSGKWDEAAREYELTVEQFCPPTPGQPEKLPFHIPLAIGLLDQDGADLPVRLANEPARPAGTRVLDIKAPKEVFRFAGLAAAPVPSLLRGFSAPVKLESDLDDRQLAFLMAHDSDPFARWEAGQTLAAKRILEMVRSGSNSVDPDLVEAIGATLGDERLDQAFIAQAIMLPSETYLAEMMDVIDVEGIHRAREAVRRAIAMAHGDRFRQLHRDLADAGPYRYDAESVGRRTLRNAALDYLMVDPDQGTLDACFDQAEHASNMTDVLAALSRVADSGDPRRLAALARFAEKWRDDALVLDKWFGIQAMSLRADTLGQVKSLMAHSAFDLKNPNKVRALIGAFSANRIRFHDPSGAGYAFLADQVIAIDGFNPRIASRMLQPMARWRKYDSGRQKLMQAEFERILAKPGLSKDTFEIARKSLDNA